MAIGQFLSVGTNKQCLIHRLCCGMTELVYGQIPGWDEYSLLDKEAAETQRQARDCSTWGEYARLAGLDWDTFVEECGQSLRDLRGDDAAAVTSETPMEVDWTSIAGSHLIGDLIQDARLAASEKLPSDLDYSEDPVLESDLQIGGSSPGPNISTVRTTDPDTFTRLESFLHEKGYDDFSISEGQDLVSACYQSS